ncbi:MAG: TetR/AcrR family transcriptional regulator [Lachnospira sp.]|nr:TetR/AcrR family transcriptional regulator [Lachnospira sp.]
MEVYELKLRKTVSTRYEILQCATKLFLEKGYTNAYVTAITKSLRISTGNLTFWFPTKEHILAELVKELCDFQQYYIDKKEMAKDDSLLMEYLFELAMFASVCEKNSNIKDLIISAYTYPLPLEIIRKNDTNRAKYTFGKYCPTWTDTDYVLAENVASGIEYAMFMTENTKGITIEQRLTSSLDAIMKLYDVPKEKREQLLAKVMSMDYRTKGNHVFEEFCSFVEEKMLKNYEKLNK